MTVNNARAFLLFGLTLIVLPLVAAGAFPTTGLDGTSGRALWLEVMGAVEMVIGAGYLGQAAVCRIVDRLATVAMPTLDRSPLAVGERENTTA